MPDQAQLDAARRVLFVLDEQGRTLGKSRLYQSYESNAQAYAQAKQAYASAQTSALGDPARADSWPLSSATYQQAVDDAYHTWQAEGAAQVEQALNTLQVAGIKP